MQRIGEFIESIGKNLEGLTVGSAVMAKPISSGERHVLPLCELSVAWGAGGGEGEGEGDTKAGHGRGTGGGGGGAAKANPVAVVVIENGKVRLEAFAS